MKRSRDDEEDRGQNLCLVLACLLCLLLCTAARAIVMYSQSVVRLTVYNMWAIKYIRVCRYCMYLGMQSETTHENPGSCIKLYTSRLCGEP
jgi:hypothetical protein